MDGLTILQKGCNISPTIYLNDYYKEYQAGKSIHNIILHIREIYRAYRPSSSVDVAFFTNFENVRHRILFKLIHYQKNEELLKIPHFRYLDFAVVFIVFYLVQVETPLFWFVPLIFPTGTSPQMRYILMP